MFPALLGFLFFIVLSNRISLQLYDFAETNCLVQCVDRLKRSSNLVDLVFIGQPILLTSFTVEPPFSLSSGRIIE